MHFGIRRLKLDANSTDAIVTSFPIKSSLAVITQAFVKLGGWWERAFLRGRSHDLHAKWSTLKSSKRSNIRKEALTEDIGEPLPVTTDQF